jgi:signal transduction histidine kinase/ActR/RegA family two-component response regulator
VFMRSRANGEKTKGRMGTGTSSLLRAGRAGANRGERILEAIQELKNEEGVDRVGVWLEERDSREGRDTESVVFRGEVWDEGMGIGIQGWTRISGDAPLPMEMLNAGKKCEYKIEGMNQGPMLGPLVALQRVLWVPVVVRRILRGLVMTGTQQKQKSLPSARAERVAEELGLLLEFEEERRLSAARKADLELVQRVRALTSEKSTANAILGELAESCTRGESSGGTGAVFALIGERKSGLPVAAPSFAPGEEQLIIRAQSGDEAWAHGVNHGPLETLWRQALEDQRVIVAEADRLPLARDISRMVAIPLERGKSVAGILIAGLARQKATPEMLERLELRAQSAAEVLQQEWRAEEALRQQLWQKALLESSGKPVVLVDSRGLLVAMSRGAWELARPEKADFAAESGNMRFAELFRPRHWEEVQEWVSSSVSKEIGKTTETLESELSGGKRVALRRLEISGQEFSVVGIEEAGMANRARTAEEAHAALKQALEWLDEGVAVFDDRGEIIAQNAKFLQILGFRQDERSNLRTLEDVIQGASKNAGEPESFAADWRALAANSTEGTQEELAMAKPVPQSIERCARAIVGPKGERLGRVEVYREMTARRMFQSRMVQTEKLASLGQRVSGIVHELSSPLTTILGNAQRMVLREETGAAPAEALQILKEAERATGIMRQLLHLSRETRRELRLVSLNELVAQTVDLQKGLMAGSGLRLKVEIAETLPSVNADFGQLQQVLLNLLQNAQQAMEESGQDGTLMVRTASGGPGRVRLEVGDDGPGIPEALQARIFDPFFTTKPAGKGTGLGLAIVSGFVRQHGGTVSVHSPPGGGTRFVVELPAAEELQEAVAREKRAHARQIEFPQAAALPGGLIPQVLTEKTPHVLVVEDEATVAALIADVLREEGMRVDVLPDGQRALEAVRQESYDLAICDLKMPGMDGQIFYGELVQSRNPLREHVLFVTGDVVAQRTQEFLERHHLPHVAKPFRVEELSVAVRRMLSVNLQAAVP